MFDAPSEEELRALPAIPAVLAEHPLSRVIHLHFSLGSREWFVAAYDPLREEVFGYRVDAEALDEGQWDTFSFAELCGLRDDYAGIVWDQNWRPTPVALVHQIVNL